MNKTVLGVLALASVLVAAGGGYWFGTQRGPAPVSAVANGNGSAGQVATSSTSQVAELSFGLPQPVFVTMPVPGSAFSPFTYTSFGLWSEPGKDGATGYFAYGIPTASGDIPNANGQMLAPAIHLSQRSFSSWTDSNPLHRTAR